MYVSRITYQPTLSCPQGCHPTSFSLPIPLLPSKKHKGGGGSINIFTCISFDNGQQGRVFKSPSRHPYGTAVAKKCNANATADSASASLNPKP